MADKDMSATDVFKFDVQAARLNYLRSKRLRGEALQVVDAPAKVRAMWDDELPAFLKHQAD